MRAAQTNLRIQPERCRLQELRPSGLCKLACALCASRWCSGRIKAAPGLGDHGGGLRLDVKGFVGERVDDATLAQRAAAVDPDGMMMICYTSGTTGHPKGVIHTHIPIRNTHERAQLMGLNCFDVHMNYLPLFHIYAFSEITMAGVITGASQVLMDAFDADQALDLAARARATVLHGFEAHWLDLLTTQQARP